MSTGTVVTGKPAGDDVDETAIDISSKKGRFGWEVLRGKCVPYIFRQVSDIYQ
jgi:hypothetical protein